MSDKIVHGTCEGDKLRDRYKEAPHDCDDPKCPGNINRQKLEIYEELIRIITDENMICCGEIENIIPHARALQESSK